MAKGFFQIKSNIEEVEKGFKDAARLMSRIEVGTVNNIAFRARELMLKEITSSMTIRSPGFVEGSVRVQKATLKSRKAITGSIKRPRFTGWEHQETGKAPGRKRTQSIAARRSKFKHRVAPRFRLKRGSKKALRPSDLGLRDSVSFPDIPAFLQILNRKRFRLPFYLPVAYKKLQRGIYIFRANKIRRIQNLNPENKPLISNKWMTRTTANVDMAMVVHEWRRSAAHFLKKQKILKVKL